MKKNTKKAGRGRKEILFSEEDKVNVETLAGYGLTTEQIARYFKVCKNTLLKNCSDNLDVGKSRGIALVTGELMNAIKNGNVTAMIFYLKTQAKWKETDDSSITINNVLPQPVLYDKTKKK